MLPNIKRGDVFCVDSDSLVADIIKWGEKLWSIDNSAEFNHSGILLSSTGKTYEALWRVKESHINNYAGKHIVIARPLFTVHNSPVTPNEINRIISIMRNRKDGAFYPVHRLFLHMLGPLVAKYLSTGHFDVCSELVTSEYLKPLRCWRGNAEGINPDNLADRLEHSGDMYQIVFKGELTI